MSLPDPNTWYLLYNNYTSPGTFLYATTTGASSLLALGPTSGSTISYWQFSPSNNDYYIRNYGSRASLQLGVT